MVKLKILLNTIDKVKRFSSIISTFENRINLQSDKHTIDAKSIVCIFGFDLREVLEVIIYDAKPEEKEKFIKAMEEFAWK